MIAKKPKVFICIPARFASTRLPGKPLIDLAGEPMLERVVEIARQASNALNSSGVATTCLVALDHEKVAELCRRMKVDFVMTDPTLRSGTDRVFQAVSKQAKASDIVINLQGDAPFTPAHFIVSLAKALLRGPKVQVATPVHRLSWLELDQLREHKAKSPFSGTTAIVDQQGNALWFSKQIIPSLRDERDLRKQSKLSPIMQHIGVYALRFAALRRYCSLPSSRYEDLEKLEQLRLLENDFDFKAVLVDYKNRPQISGIDSPQDVKKAIQLLKQLGE